MKKERGGILEKWKGFSETGYMLRAHKERGTEKSIYLFLES
jgi:hypothetical protein